jgi:hypothetical protein
VPPACRQLRLRLRQLTSITLRLAPVVVVALVLAAHFYRAGELAAFAVTLGTLALLAVRRPWAARAFQGGLALGALEWLRTLALLVQARQATGQPYLRLALILAAVALATALAALVFRSRTVRAHFRLARPNGGGDPPRGGT